MLPMCTNVHTMHLFINNFNLINQKILKNTKKQILSYASKLYEYIQHTSIENQHIEKAETITKIIKHKTVKINQCNRLFISRLI